MVWRYLDVPQGISQYELLREVGGPLDSVLPNMTLRLRDAAFQIYVIDDASFDGQFDDSRREILISSNPSALRLALTHEIGHLAYSYGLREDDKEGGPWRERVKDTAHWRYLEQSKETGFARVISLGQPDGSVPIDVGELDYLLRWDELFARAFAQYVASKSGDAEMCSAIVVRTRPAPNVPFYPHHWLDADFGAVQVALDSLFAELGWL